MLLCVLLCLSPGVVVLRGVVGGDGVGNIAGAAHCECWLVGDVVGVNGGCVAGVAHSVWSRDFDWVVLSAGTASTRFSQKSLP